MGGCKPPAPSPNGPGTIMSYCHIGGYGINIDFHPIVINNALNPGINSASCLTTCDFYGCTDANASNFDPNATIDDGSCLYIPVITAITSNVSCSLFDTYCHKLFFQN